MPSHFGFENNFDLSLLSGYLNSWSITSFAFIALENEPCHFCFHFESFNIQNTNTMSWRRFWGSASYSLLLFDSMKLSHYTSLCRLVSKLKLNLHCSIRSASQSTQIAEKLFQASNSLSWYWRPRAKHRIKHWCKRNRYR